MMDCSTDNKKIGLTAQPVNPSRNNEMTMTISMAIFMSKDNVIATVNVNVHGKLKCAHANANAIANVSANRNSQ